MSRQQFVVGFVEALQEKGLDHAQCKAAVSTMAKLADELSDEQFVELLDDVSNGRTKQAMDKLSAPALSAMLGGLKDLGVAGLSAGANVAGDVTRGLIQAGPAAATLGVVAPAVLGYGVGHAASGLMDDPSKVISEAKHREIVSRLRENARLLRQQTPATVDDESEQEQTV